ncbi:hypothetical protein JZO67_001152 [Enterococcus sp. 665A]|uniref:Uncharacterized protein n=1 Tax=Candidatus Enterococcus ferrettii TaxID=2815324 RepID=A0ABV0EKN6_9ENTE
MKDNSKLQSANTECNYSILILQTKKTLSSAFNLPYKRIDSLRISLYVCMYFEVITKYDLIHLLTLITNPKKILPLFIDLAKNRVSLSMDN